MKKWPLLQESELDLVVGPLPKKHVAIKVRYPGDPNWYITCRKLPPLDVIKTWKRWKELPEK